MWEDKNALIWAGPRLRLAASFRSNISSQLTNYTEHGASWEANGSSASEEIVRILWNPKVIPVS